MITVEQLIALKKLYTTVIRTVGNTAYDADGNEVAYDLQAVNTKVAQDEADETAKQQAEVVAKQSALAKLTALGLTQAEIKALVG
jgi:hypothetical protein